MKKVVAINDSSVDFSLCTVDVLQQNIHGTVILSRPSMERVNTRNERTTFDLKGTINESSMV